MWRQITGENPPTIPPTSKEYSEAGLPWFDYYDEKQTAVEGSETLSKLKSIVEKGKEKNDMPLPENESVINDYIIKIRKGLKKGQVREFRY